MNRLQFAPCPVSGKVTLTKATSLTDATKGETLT